MPPPKAAAAAAAPAPAAISCKPPSLAEARSGISLLATQAAVRLKARAAAAPAQPLQPLAPTARAAAALTQPAVDGLHQRADGSRCSRSWGDAAWQCEAAQHSRRAFTCAQSSGSSRSRRPEQDRADPTLLCLAHLTACQAALALFLPRSARAPAGCTCKDTATRTATAVSVASW